MSRPTAPAPTAAPQANAPGLGALFREVPRDLWHFVSFDTAVVLGSGGALALIAHGWDDEITGMVAEAGTLYSTVASVDKVGNTYGAFATQVGIGFAIYGVGRGSGHPHLAVAGADIVRAQVVSQAWTQAIKYTVQRERPDGSDHVSFPSGHSASAFATATVLQRHYGWRVGAPSFVVAGLVGTARIRSNRHHLSDVVFGAAMGIAGGRTVVLHAGRYGVHVAPALVPDGAAVMVSVARR